MLQNLRTVTRFCVIVWIWNKSYPVHGFRDVNHQSTCLHIYLHTHKCILLHSRDLVHRQTACWAVKHMALGVYGFGCEDALVHLTNCVWPNIFETSPHMVQSFNDAVEGLRVAVGPGKVLLYTLQVSSVFEREIGQS